MRNIKLIFFLFILLSTCGLSFYLFAHVSQPISNPLASHNPDSYMVDAKYYKMDKQGKLYTTLTAEYVQHTPHQNTTRLHKPSLEIQSAENHWIIHSEHARSENELNSIYLWKNVCIERVKSDSAVPITAKTESLLVFPHDELVETNNIVTIQQPGLEVSGKGLLGNLKHGNLKILNHLQSTITPIS